MKAAYPKLDTCPTSPYDNCHSSPETQHKAQLHEQDDQQRDQQPEKQADTSLHANPSDAHPPHSTFPAQASQQQQPQPQQQPSTQQDGHQSHQQQPQQQSQQHQSPRSFPVVCRLLAFATMITVLSNALPDMWDNNPRLAQVTTDFLRSAMSIASWALQCVDASSTIRKHFGSTWRYSLQPQATLMRILHQFPAEASDALATAAGGHMLGQMKSLQGNISRCNVLNTAFTT